MGLTEQLARLDERLNGMDQKLDKVIHAIEGNGKPGLIIRVDRVEQRWKAIAWVLAIVGGTVIVELIQKVL